MLTLFGLISSLRLEGMNLLIGLFLIYLLFVTAKLPKSLIWGLLWKFKWFLLITFLANLMFSPSHSFLFGDVFRQNLPLAFTVVGRLVMMLLLAVWLSFVTRPFTLINSLNLLLRPLLWFKIPIYHITLVMSLILRFIPELMTVIDNIVFAQRLRGVSPGLKWKNGRIWITSTLIPLFMLSIRKSSQMAIAMESRGFSPGKEISPLEELKFKISDYIIILVSIIGLIGIFIYR